MKYYKTPTCSNQWEYYCVEANNKPFWWYRYAKGEWSHTTTDGFSEGETWEHWKNNLTRWGKGPEKVSKLEVLVVCGSVKG
jgi:hypothetical protein